MVDGGWWIPPPAREQPQITLISADELPSRLKSADELE
jgi:hypothetical protein